MKRRWLKRTLLGLAALLLVLVLALSWLGGTGSGLRFALGRAVIALDDRLSYASAEGSLFGGMRLREVVYQDPAIGRYQIALLEIAPRSRRLLGGELHLTGLHLDQVEVTLPPPAEPATATEAFMLPEVRLPIAVRIDELVVAGVDVRSHDEVQILRLDRIEGAGHWRGAAFALERLRVLAPEGELGLAATVDTGADWAGLAEVDLRGQLPGRPQPLAGRLVLRGPQSQPTLELDLVEPSAARVELGWTGRGSDARWQLSAESQGFDLAAVLAQPPIDSIGFALQGRGDRDSAELEGQVRLDDYPVVVERLAGHWREQRLGIDALALAEAQGPGRLQAEGLIDFSGSTPTGQVQARWQAISPPLAAPFQALAATGQLAARGTLEHLAVELDAAATVDDRPLQVAARIEGDPQGIVQLQPLTLHTGEGRLDVTGHIDLADGLAWQAQLAARGFDPGLLLPDWPGQVDLDGSSQGRLVDGEMIGALEIDRLGGRLRGRPLAGDGRVELADGGTVDATLDLRLGDNRIDLAGRLAPALNARARFRLPEPGLLLEGASGQAEGELKVSGTWPNLAVAGRVDGSDLDLGGDSVGSLAIELDGRSDLVGENVLRVDARDLVLAGETIDRLQVSASGDAASNQVRLQAEGERGSVDMRLTGRWEASATRWSGELQRLRLAVPDLPEALDLAEPVALTLAPDQVTLEQACLRAQSSGLCLGGTWQRGVGGELGYELSRLPLAWLLAASGEQDMAIDGELGGRGRFAIDASGGVSGSGTLQAPPGRLHMPESGRELLAWSALDGSLELDGARRALDATLALSPSGRIQVRLVSGTRDGDSGDLAGQVELELDDLKLLELVSTDVLEPVGRVRGRLDIGGTRTAPTLQGRIDLTGFGAELPALGLRLRDSQVALHAGSGNRIEVEGRLATGPDNALALGGWFGLPVDGRVPMELTIEGSNVLVADLPAARVVASPDLSVTSNARGLQVRGSVAIPQARLAPDQFEAGAAAASPDVVVIDPDALPDAQTSEAPVALPVYATVTVTLGDRVEIDGYGLEGRLRGELVVRERPGRTTSARGEIVVTGTYQAYGQDLDIERGRLLFTGGAIDNPLLDIRAIRRISTVTAGLAVTGTARRPVLEVYSVPAMDQAEALSWLVLGRPLRQATSSADQDLLGTAATAVTTAGGDLLAKAVGARLGLDDVGVGSSRELGAGALTLGKYLSPRLYLGYGRSLFDGSQLVTLRYKLSRRLEAEVQSGTRENKAGLNYSYER